MADKKKVAFIFGTRPEAIKLCPVIQEMRQHPTLTAHVCVTAQHRQMLDQVLEVFEIAPDSDLDLMRPGQTLAGLTSRSVAAIDKYLAVHKPDMVMVQGDTTTVLCASLVSFYHRIPVAHVEAGLRTWDKYSPFPEEINRVLTTNLAEYHFAPTAWAQNNLLKEGIPAERVFLTGNTVVDALMIAVVKVRAHPQDIPGLPSELLRTAPARPMVLITGHRRESFGQGFENICLAIARLAKKFPEALFVYPVHLNPNVHEPVHRLLGNLDNVCLLAPLSYLPFVSLMDRCTLILTDSGGVQEEAPSLGKPVLVMRDTTERPEAVEAGTAILVGTDPEAIYANAAELLASDNASARMQGRKNPYGDGDASKHITSICENILVSRSQLV